MSRWWYLCSTSLTVLPHHNWTSTQVTNEWLLGNLPWHQTRLTSDIPSTPCISLQEGCVSKWSRQEAHRHKWGIVTPAFRTATFTLACSSGEYCTAVWGHSKHVNILLLCWMSPFILSSLAVPNQYCRVSPGPGRHLPCWPSTRCSYAQSVVVVFYQWLVSLRTSLHSSSSQLSQKHEPIHWICPTSNVICLLPHSHYSSST